MSGLILSLELCLLLSFSKWIQKVSSGPTSSTTWLFLHGDISSLIDVISKLWDVELIDLFVYIDEAEIIILMQSKIWETARKPPSMWWRFSAEITNVQSTLGNF